MPLAANDIRPLVQRPRTRQLAPSSEFVEGNAESQSAANLVA
jgi:hypothetical protein